MKPYIFLTRKYSSIFVEKSNWYSSIKISHCTIRFFMPSYDFPIKVIKFLLKNFIYLTSKRFESEKLIILNEKKKKINSIIQKYKTFHCRISTFPSLDLYHIRFHRFLCRFRLSHTTNPANNIVILEINKIIFLNSINQHNELINK